MFTAESKNTAMIYRCTECGIITAEWSGRCPNWQNHGNKEQWNTLEEQPAIATTSDLPDNEQ